MAARRLTNVELLGRYEVQPDGCWLWTGSIAPNGYGRISTGSRTDGTRSSEYAHRFFYLHHVGAIPQDRPHLDHLCRNRACVNPGHLEPVTLTENIMRSPIAPTAVNARKTHCKNGHPFDCVRGRSRGCRTCDRERMRVTRANRRREVAQNR